MGESKVASVTRMFNYNLWANCELIKICMELNEEQLAVEVAGVFGQIRPTLIHILRAEDGYLNRMTGSRPFPEDTDWANITIAQLLPLAEESGKRLVEIAAALDPDVKHEVELPDRTVKFFNWTVLLQALYHGIEHRTQTKILLTKLGVEHPELAAWDYTDSLFE